MPERRKARQAVESGRASVCEDERIIPQAGRDLKRDDPERWARGCAAIGAGLCAVLAFVALCECGVLP